MATPSRVETIFSAALGKNAGAERANYLVQACGADAGLRLKVERLLEAHPQAMDFLAEPAVDRGQFDSDAATDDLTSLAPPSGQERSPREREARTELNETLSNERGDDVEGALGSRSPGK